MTPGEISDRLFKKVWDLSSPVPLAWKMPVRPVRDPLNARPDSSWREVKKAEPLKLRANADNWFHADLIFPSRKSNIELAGQAGTFWIGLWCPFTLWLDGKEIFREDHTWHATGPIFAPLIEAIEPGRKYHLALCLRPTSETMFSFLRPDSIMVNAMPCIETGVDLAAVASEVRLAAGAAKSPKEEQLVADAVARIDLKAMDREDWPRFYRSVDAAEKRLAPVADAVRQMTVHVLGYTHIDMDWMWTWEDTLHCIRRDFRAVTDMMEDIPGLTFGMSQVPIYQAAQKHDPEVFAKVQQFIKDGRWENWAGAWVENDLHTADGESIARHMLYAADWTREHLGAPASIHFAPDTFGHPGNMPQLMKLAGQDTYYHARANPGKHNEWPAWLWTGSDGTEVLAICSHYKGDLVLPEVGGELLMPPVFAAQKLGLRDVHWMCGLGDHGGGVTRRHIELLGRFSSRPIMPRFRFSTLQQLRAALLKQKDKLPRHSGEMFQIFEGCYTTHAQMKRLHRRSESALLDAEAMTALAGLNRTDTLRSAWHDVLYNQFHDIVCGAGVPITYRDAYRRARKAIKVAEGVTDESITKLVRAGRPGVSVVNSLGHARSEVVHADLPASTGCLADQNGNPAPVQQVDGQSVFIAEQVPAFGARQYRPVKGDAAPAVQVSEDKNYFTVETEYFRCQLLKASGIIGSCFDKRLQRELVGYGVPKAIRWVTAGVRTELALNVFQVMDEAPHALSAWLIQDVVRQENLLSGAKVDLIDAGPVCARFRVQHRFRSSRIDQVITFYQHLPRIEFDTTIDWREKGGADKGVPMLKVAFATAMSAARATFEGPYSIVQRPSDGQEQVTQKWADLTGDEFGFTLYNDSRYGCDALGGQLRLTLVRNSYDPDPDSDAGRHVARFAFEPHAPGRPIAEAVRQGMSFNRPLIATAGALRRPLVDLQWTGSDSIVCTALRPAEHSEGLLLRFFETAGRAGTLQLRPPAGYGVVHEVDFLERPLRTHTSGSTRRFRLGPFQVKSLLLRRL